MHFLMHFLKTIKGNLRKSEIEKFAQKRGEGT